MTLSREAMIDRAVRKVIPLAALKWSDYWLIPTVDYNSEKIRQEFARLMRGEGCGW